QQDRRVVAGLVHHGEVGESVGVEGPHRQGGGARPRADEGAGGPGELAVPLPRRIVTLLLNRLATEGPAERYRRAAGDLLPLLTCAPPWCERAPPAGPLVGLLGGKAPRRSGQHQVADLVRVLDPPHLPPPGHLNPMLLQDALRVAEHPLPEGLVPPRLGYHL